jgi:hypothetical protein
VALCLKSQPKIEERSRIVTIARDDDATGLVMSIGLFTKDYEVKQFVCD